MLPRAENSPGWLCGEDEGKTMAPFSCPLLACHMPVFATKSPERKIKTYSPTPKSASHVKEIRSHRLWDTHASLCQSSAASLSPALAASLGSLSYSHLRELKPPLAVQLWSTLSYWANSLGSGDKPYRESAE
ncbi:Rho guanine nucleotide exchange factor 10-like protein [Dissostichus eleginoides]|uniref:Rho guanine nucleotide exchange factor 10-like protein n=1 Tax=Dissostichus eleginoides TaxID=100907 RepID=A0AAD9CLS4_DISEL|nr:Rho guanine nucleotide exchange factor 10-like protein [Dissostichus eleginoides]